jgi:hypothetical protein
MSIHEGEPMETEIPDNKIDRPPPMPPFNALCTTFGFVTALGGAASAFIVLIALVNLHMVSDTGMFAIALMAAAPAGLGVGVALFLYLSFTVEAKRVPDNHGAAEPFIRRMDGPRG